MKKTILFLLISLCSFTFAQDKSDSNFALEKLVNYTEKNYPGFDEKSKDKVLYEHFKNSLLEKSKKITDSKETLALLKEYLSFFRDRHIFFLDDSNSLKLKKIDKIENLKVKKILSKISNSKDSLEGIWKNEEFKIGILKVKDSLYKGFVITSENKIWKANDVLFTLNTQKKMKLFSSDLTYFDDTYELKNAEILRFTKTRKNFFKDNNNQLSPEILNQKINELFGLSVKKISPKTTLVKLQNFDYPFVEKIEKLINDNKTLIENSENLIIDLRDNGGGTTNSMTPILPYIMGGKVRSMNVEYFVSDFYISNQERYVKNLPDTDKYKEEKKNILDNLLFYKENMGKYVLRPNTKSVETENYEASAKSPKQVVVLVNKKVASSGEVLTLLAKQSKKVKIMGTPTSGVLDYANAMISNYEYDGHSLILPTYRSLRLPDFPIDNIGVQPDIYLDESVEDWVKFATDYLEN